MHGPPASCASAPLLHSHPSRSTGFLALLQYVRGAPLQTDGICCPFCLECPVHIPFLSWALSWQLESNAPHCQVLLICLPSRASFPKHPSPSDILYYFIASCLLSISSHNHLGWWRQRVPCCSVSLFPTVLLFPTVSLEQERAWHIEGIWHPACEWTNPLI